MGETTQQFSASLAKDAVYRTGLRSFMEYRDLGDRARRPTGSSAPT